MPGEAGARQDDGPCRRVLFASDHYEALGVPRGSGDAAVRAEFKRRALEVHPDKNASPLAEKAFQRLQAAQRVLLDPEARRSYDEGLQRAGGWLRWARAWGREPRSRVARRILVLRHGSRPAEGVDPPLDVLGKWQAEQLAAYFAREAAGPGALAPVTALFCSPFRRALQTAAPLARVLGLPISVEWGFCDLLAHEWLYAADPLPLLKRRKKKSLPGYPQFNKLYQSSVMPEYPDVEGRIEPGNEQQRRRARQRHQAALEVALSTAGGGSVLIIGHGATHDFIAEAFCPAQHSVKHHSGGYSVPFGGITEIVEEGDGWRLAALGHTRWAEEDIPPEAWRRAREATEATLYRSRATKKAASRSCPLAGAAAAAAVAVLAVLWIRRLRPPSR